MGEMKGIFKRVSSDRYLSEIEAAYSNCNNVQNISKWHKRFDFLRKAVENGKSTYHKLENHIFELKVINYIHNISPHSHIVYEPPGMNREGKNCDLLVKSKQTYLIELKSFNPEKKATAIPHEHITKGNVVDMDPYSYHELDAVRHQLIDTTNDTEDKMMNYDDNQVNVMGIHLNRHLLLEDLRDFVTIYRTGKHKIDDPLGKMTIYNLKQKFKGIIEEFWGFPFREISFGLEHGEKAISVYKYKDSDKELVSL
jgi:hypothetical protein